MATKIDKIKSKLNEATEAYLAQLKATHEAKAPSDGEHERADREAQIAYLEAHLDEQNA
jgi:hypothetical protein